MSRIGPRNTQPELAVRKLAHALGYRFRLHRRTLPGSPDLVFPRLKKAVFVHGCFWHRHDCKKATTPKSNTDFWQTKFRQNIERDNRKLAEIRGQGWDAVVIWECETRDLSSLRARLEEFLGDES